MKATISYMASLHTPHTQLPAQRQQGFTTIELMVVVAIIAILGGLAAPSFKNVIESMRVNSSIEDMTNTIYYARSEAIKRGGAVAIRKRCTAGAATNWDCGWRVVTDINRNGILDPGTDAVLKNFPPPQNMTITHNTSSTSLALDGWGQIPPDSFTFQPQNSSGTQYTHTLCLSSGGRIRVEKNSSTC